MKVNGTNPPLIERKITVFADPTRKARSWEDTTIDVNFERMYKKCISVLAKLVASKGKSKTEIYTYHYQRITNGSSHTEHGEHGKEGRHLRYRRVP